mmetsp:Transcript_89703/g.159402  ORF Transcript_89703/g.159402 Transcript_89703/m.159402 type:complete len:132 (-) Transcript_89703:45-440(-)|eukprot:CAMPEP_0197655440 /NCGR_PEP_ID=MMETSP1338-20131121/39454_1 /TAXON_ID=43686 ORGANISM="Pelagodinium beii, Strain RCC1491" /NCGR_SAMPLE_ID=MMETSP1338 /ASSEMBLY_ACC=CAM_ASM_000754 /LENGTH=131 /DNA_ID=CAMNT_0043231085 /DNA_START=68 /DNA_END=463 /DNA_ORIENTATION=-
MTQLPPLQLSGSGAHTPSRGSSRSASTPNLLSPTTAFSTEIVLRKPPQAVYAPSNSKYGGFYRQGPEAKAVMSLNRTPIKQDNAFSQDLLDCKVGFFRLRGMETKMVPGYTKGFEKGPGMITRDWELRLMP